MVRSPTASLSLPLSQLRNDLRQILRAGVDAVDPERLVREALGRIDSSFVATDSASASPSEAPCVVAVGKAARPMFTAVASAIRVGPTVLAIPLTAARPGRGVAAPTARGAHETAGERGERKSGDEQGAPESGARLPRDSRQAAREDDHVSIFEAGHPAPNQASAEAGEAALALAHKSASRGGLLVLLSGGASAMMVAPVPGVPLDDKVETSRRLMAAGAPIHELNCVRKHLSRIKGGQLAAAARRTLTLALSDVHAPLADDPSVIGSGPTVPDETTFSDALAIARSRRVTLPSTVLEYLERGARGEVAETVKPGDPRVAESVHRIVGNRQAAAEAARRAAESCGYHVIIIAPPTTGEAREAARAFVTEARRLGETAPRPLCVIGSGETTVTVRGGGVGGRNQEFALAAAPDLAQIGVPAVLGSAGTDGIDGPTDAAGAVADSMTIDRSAPLGLDADAALAANDAYRFFEPLGDLILWGPTGTNVGDLHVLLIG
ncbi:MAG: glycerate kinase type-2 family protein [Vicinamibacterales bacterium]